MPALPYAPAGARLVLVEDDADVRRSVTMMLRARGFSLDVFETGVEVLASGYLPQADCWLVDYKMPGLDGLELLRRLRSNGLTTPALLITGYLSNALEAPARAAGFCRVLEKPATADLLTRHVASLISGP